MQGKRQLVSELQAGYVDSNTFHLAASPALFSDKRECSRTDEHTQSFKSVLSSFVLGHAKLGSLYEFYCILTYTSWHHLPVIVPLFTGLIKNESLLLNILSETIFYYIPFEVMS